MAGKNPKPNEYVRMGQNDVAQVQQLVREYQGSPAMGIAHGVQKDAIQNGWGARRIKDERRACGEWAFHFELLEIQKKPALVFWDEGTFGLTGQIVDNVQIEKMSEAGLLGSEHADERLGRFLTRFESGGNIGAGTFGRGKLIFQGASQDFVILIDSLREDGKYIALDRKIRNKTSLVQPPIPYQGEAAVKFLKDQTNGAVKKLTKPGTRIIILNVHEEVVKTFRNSFDPKMDAYAYSDVFSKMIEETWWEILQYGAKIWLHLDGNKKTVDLDETMLLLAQGKNKTDGIKVYEKKLIPVIVEGDRRHHIKEIKFVLFPNAIDENIRQIWIQRKRMKIGPLPRDLRPDHRIEKKVAGYVILDKDLEERIIEYEGTTHYGFNNGRPLLIRNLTEAIKTELDKFHEQLGFSKTEDAGRAREEMAEMLKELNETAKDLGLLTNLGAGGEKKKDVKISINSIVTPTAGSLRINNGDNLGPISFTLTNALDKSQSLKVAVKTEQAGKTISTFLELDCDLSAGEKKQYTVDPFKIAVPQFAMNEKLVLRIEAVEKESDRQLDSVARTFWLGMEAPQAAKDPVSITAYMPEMPRESRRVEIGESIKNIRFKIWNETSTDLKINVDMIVRKAKSSTHEVSDLITIVSERGMALPSLGDKEFVKDLLPIDPESFKTVIEEEAVAEERRCEIYFSIRAAENYPDLNIIQGQHLGQKKAFAFYLNVDPEGSSIFNKSIDVDEPQDGRRSWVTGDRATGYTFYLNTGHRSWKFVDIHEKEIKRNYLREQFLFQGYLIAFQQDLFRGPAEQFKELLSGDLPPADAARYIDQIIGSALNEAPWE